MATLKEKINYITNQFTAGKPALTGEPSNEFLIGVISELAADESNYTEFKDSIPAIHKAAMEELEASTNDSKHVLVASLLKNSGITSTLKDENVTQKPIFVEYLLNKGNVEGNDALNKEVTALMNHAFDDKNNRIEVSSLIAVANMCVTEAQVDENSVLNRYMSSKGFSGEDYSKFCGALLAFDKLKESFDYDLTENQSTMLATTLSDLENFRKEALSDPTSKLEALLTAAEKKYSKAFFSNDLDIEAQLHKVRAEENLSASAGMISGYDLGTPVKDTAKENAALKADEEKFNLMMTWEEKYNNYLNSLNDIRVMTAGDKFQKRFALHGFAPSTSNLFGDSVVKCDKFGQPDRTLWNISPFSGTMKLSVDLRYDDASSCEKAFTIAALNARRQGWDSVYLNHPGPKADAQAFITQSFKAMVHTGGYSFEAINVPRRYQYIIDQLIREEMTASIKNNANVSDELRNSEALRPEDPSKEEVEQAAPAKNAPETPTNTSTQDSDSISNTLDNPREPVAANPDTVIPDAFDDDKLAFDIPKDTDQAPLDDFEAARREETSHDFDNSFDDSHLEPERHVHDQASYEPTYDEERYESIPDHHQDYGNQQFDNTDINIEIPEELKNDQKASLDDQGDGSAPKSGTTKKIVFRQNRP